jgi:hypothetical protein
MAPNLPVFLSAVPSWLFVMQAWAMLDQMTAQFRVQFPILQRVVDFFVGFFHQAGPRQAA